MKYLFIGAHPDDIEFSCGGTILRLVSEGHDVNIIVMSKGESATHGAPEQRIEEQLKASCFCGIKKPYILNYKDGRIQADNKVISRITEILDKEKPDFVITHYPCDSHQDHRNVASAVLSATRRKHCLLYFNSFSSIGFRPNLYVTIDKFAELKQGLLSLFGSQVRKYLERGLDFAENALTRDKVNGYECGAKFAEGYYLEHYVMKEKNYGNEN